MKILFQGDSITDAHRDRSDYHNLGEGYPKYAAEFIKKQHPNINFEFINLGISGNCTFDLVNRLEADFIEIKPDIVSVLIGINDVWHFADGKKWRSNADFEKDYRTVLIALKQKTDAKIMMLEPFLIPVADKEFFREDLDFKIDTVRKLAREFADIYLPTDGLLASEYIGKNPTDFAADGVHPTPYGAEFIGKIYAEYISKLIDEAEK